MKTKWVPDEAWVLIDPMDGSPPFYYDEETGERMEIEEEDDAD